MDMGQALNNSNQTIDQQELNKALIEAAKLGKVDVIDLLIQRGANIHATNNLNETALIIARKNHHNTVGYRLLWEMTPNQRKEYANQIISNCDHFFWFEQALKNNANKLFDIVMPALHIGSNSPLMGSLFDISVWHKIELLKHDFPAWYQDCIPQHFNLALSLAKKYHSAKFRDAFSYLTHPIPEPSNFSRLCSFATNSLSSIGNTCFNTAKPYLPSFITNRMQIEDTEDSTQKMEIDGIDEPEGYTVNKRKHDDKNHQEGPERKRLKQG